MQKGALDENCREIVWYTVILLCCAFERTYQRRTLDLLCLNSLERAHRQIEFSTSRSGYQPVDEARNRSENFSLGKANSMTMKRLAASAGEYLYEEFSLLQFYASHSHTTLSLSSIIIGWTFFSVFYFIFFRGWEIIVAQHKNIARVVSKIIQFFMWNQTHTTRLLHYRKCCDTPVLSNLHTRERHCSMRLSIFDWCTLVRLSLDLLISDMFATRFWLWTVATSRATSHRIKCNFN